MDPTTNLVDIACDSLSLWSAGAQTNIKEIFVDKTALVVPSLGEDDKLEYTSPTDEQVPALASFLEFLDAQIPKRKTGGGLWSSGDTWTVKRTAPVKNVYRRATVVTPDNPVLVPRTVNNLSTYVTRKNLIQEPDNPVLVPRIVKHLSTRRSTNLELFAPVMVQRIIKNIRPTRVVYVVTSP